MKSFKKICQFCGKEFVTTKNVQKFCCLTCANRYISHHGVSKKICQFCGKEFIAVKNQKFCSVKCRDQCYRRNGKVDVNKEPTHFTEKKSLDKWMDEARQCGMSYGTYRAAIERLGKTFDELKKIS